LVKRARSLGLLRVAVAAMFISAVIATDPLIAGTQGRRRPTPPPDQGKTEPTVPAPKDVEKKAAGKGTQLQLSPAETIVETTIFAYGGRKQLDTVRASIEEDGNIRLATDQGDLSGSYILRSVRKEKSWLDLVRVDIELKPAESGSSSIPSAIKYIIAFNGASVWSAQNGQYVNPRHEAEMAFRAQMTHEYMSLLRYKEDASKLELIGPETVVGVDTNVIEMTNTNGEKTRYWVSSKTYRIVYSEYELTLAEAKPPTKYRLAYYYTPFRVIQGTLVPVRRVMTQDGKFVQEITLGNINYTAKLDPEIFLHLQEQ
jgi:hypothetical protein